MQYSGAGNRSFLTEYGLVFVMSSYGAEQSCTTFMPPFKDVGIEQWHCLLICLKFRVSAMTLPYIDGC